MPHKIEIRSESDQPINSLVTFLSAKYPELFDDASFVHIQKGANSFLASKGGAQYFVGLIFNDDCPETVSRIAKIIEVANEEGLGGVDDYIFYKFSSDTPYSSDEYKKTGLAQWFEGLKRIMTKKA